MVLIHSAAEFLYGSCLVQIVCSDSHIRDLSENLYAVPDISITLNSYSFPPLLPPKLAEFRILVSKVKVSLSSVRALFNASLIMRSRSSL